jgi:hypothetical protein
MLVVRPPRRRVLDSPGRISIIGILLALATTVACMRAKIPSHHLCDQPRIESGDTKGHDWSVRSFVPEVLGIQILDFLYFSKEN